MALTKRKRFEIFKRDEFTCRYCGKRPPGIVLEVDHIVPKSKDGPDDDINLITSCFDCNRGKSDVPLDRVIKPLEDMVSDERERREQLKEYNKFLRSIKDEDDEEVQRIGTVWFDEIADESEKGCWVFDDARARTIRDFLAKLPVVEIEEAVDLAIERIPVSRHRDGMKKTNDEMRWRYFCGICWNKIKGIKPTRRGR